MGLLLETFNFILILHSSSILNKFEKAVVKLGGKKSR